jgi:hypothetical protein
LATGGAGLGSPCPGSSVLANKPERVFKKLFLPLEKGEIKRGSDNPS